MAESWRETSMINRLIPLAVEVVRRQFYRSNFFFFFYQVQECSWMNVGVEKRKEFQRERGDCTKRNYEAYVIGASQRDADLGPRLLSIPPTYQTLFRDCQLVETARQKHQALSRERAYRTSLIHTHKSQTLSWAVAVPDFLCPLTPYTDNDDPYELQVLGAW